MKISLLIITLIGSALAQHTQPKKQLSPLRYKEYLIDCRLILPLSHLKMSGSCILDEDSLEAYLGTDSIIHVRPKPGKILYKF